MTTVQFEVTQQVWDDEFDVFGIGQIVEVTETHITVYYPEISEIIEYTQKEVIKHLNSLD